LLASLNLKVTVVVANLVVEPATPCRCKWVDKERHSGSAGWGLGYNPIPLSSSSRTIEIKTNVIPVIIGATGTTFNHSAET